jgi:putative ABC transport system ATP-binding protein
VNPDLEVLDLGVEYNSGGYVVRPIDGLNFHARSGQLVILLGPSGCGKTTLLSCLAGILSPTRGLVRFGYTEVQRLRGEALIRYRRESVGIVFQAFNLIPSLNAVENVAAPLLAVGGSSRVARQKATGLLEGLGLGDRLHHHPGDLSGGQQQRVAIARALVNDPPLLLADEPTAHLDYIQVDGVIRALRQLATPGRVVVVSTHDERLLPLADKVVELAPKFREAAAPPERLELAAGHVLFRQGDRGDRIYVVEAGQVELVRQRDDGTEERLAVSGPGDYFGELGPLLGFPRAATARAANAAIVTAYSVADFKARFGLNLAPTTADPPPAAKRARVTRRRAAAG